MALTICVVMAFAGHVTNSCSCLSCPNVSDNSFRLSLYSCYLSAQSNSDSFKNYCVHFKELHDRQLTTFRPC